MQASEKQLCNINGISYGWFYEVLKKILRKKNPRCITSWRERMPKAERRDCKEPIGQYC